LKVNPVKAVIFISPCHYKRENMTNPSHSQSHILAIFDNSQIETKLSESLRSEGYEITICQNRDEINKNLVDRVPHLLIIAGKVEGDANLDLASEIIQNFPGISIVLILEQEADYIIKKALQIGISDVIVFPEQDQDFLVSIQNCLEKNRRLKDWILIESTKANTRLERRLNEMETFSHDLRSPLTAIMGYAELIERVGPVNSLQRDFLQRVVTSTRSIATMVEDLLNLSKLEAGIDFQFEKILLSEMIDFIDDEFQKPVWDKQINLFIKIPKEQTFFLGDRLQIRKLIENLLENAIKYTPPKGNVTIRSEVVEDQLLFQVSDTGIGIPPTEQKKIFEKFFRGSNVARNCDGTGLGLSIVQSIVNNHQGRIWVDSTLGNGTTFSVLLPLGIKKQGEILPES
jgi:signal transduction histidine kinase